MTLQEALFQAYEMEFLGLRPPGGRARDAINAIVDDVYARERRLDELRAWARLIKNAADRAEPPRYG